MSGSKRPAPALSGISKRVAAEDKATCTIAIDFGTAGTGYAYSFTGSDVIEAKEPGGQEARKTLTNLLLDASTGAFKSFGYAARREYFEMEPGKGAFFQNFKMALSSIDGSGFYQVKALDGSTWKLMDVVVKTLKYVKDEALKEAGRALPYGIDAKDVQWVVTVPAIWSDVAKGFMRSAAYRAGLIKEEDSKRLLFALEPESAAIAADVHKVTKPGDSFMVLDTGGGTVDITMNRLVSASPLKFDEIAAPSGGPWGSTYVDKQFESFVENLVGAHNFQKLKGTPFWIEQLENWEAVKVSMDGGDDQRSINMGSILEVIDAMKLNDLVDAYNRSYGTTLKMRGKSTVVFPASVLKTFFTPVVDNIKRHVAGLLARNPVKTIFLVGGFAESALLQSAIKERFTSSRVVVPVRPGLAVLRGAVSFGKNQDVFASRVARASYGFLLCNPYDAAEPAHVGAPTVTKIVKGHPKLFVPDVYTGLVTVGDQLPAGHRASRLNLTPNADGQTVIDFEIFSTPLGRVDFTTHPSVTKLGMVTVPCLKDAGETSNLHLEFGSTEITALAVNNSTGVQRSIKLQYNFN